MTLEDLHASSVSHPLSKNEATPVIFEIWSKIKSINVELTCRTCSKNRLILCSVLIVNTIVGWKYNLEQIVLLDSYFTWIKQ